MSNPHYREVQPLTTCPHDLSQVNAIDHERRQLFDLPPIEIDVTEYQAEIHCQQQAEASFAVNLAPEKTGKKGRPKQ